MAAENKYTRVIELDDAELLRLVTEKGDLVASGRAIAREIEALQGQQQKLKKELESMSGKVGTAARRAFKRVQKLAKGMLTEWEMPITTEVRDGKVVLIVSDALAEFQDTFRMKDKFGPTK